MKMSASNDEATPINNIDNVGRVAEPDEGSNPN